MDRDDPPAGDPAVWLLIDDRAGNRSQCLGVAEALGLKFEVRGLEYTAAGALPHGFLGASFFGLTRKSRAELAPPWPDLVIAAGRRTAPVARRIKRLNGGATYLVQIMDPGSTGIDEFDLIAAPRHDRIAERPNVMRITGAPHRITPARLAAAEAEWRGRLAGLPRPWIALIVGGSTRRRTFTDAMARDLGRTASAMAADAGGALLVTTSRRTGAAAQALLGEIAVPNHVYTWGDEGENPYYGYLAVADAVIVTGDSVSMCSEACATTGPVYIYAPKALSTAKHARLHRELFEKGYARPLAGRLETWTHAPLNPAGDVARAVRERMPG
ncbi:MAG: mitochondrial fission ELM1 family protein [Rhodospirillales bacterium]